MRRRGPSGERKQKVLPFAKALSHASNETAFFLPIFLLRIKRSPSQRFYRAAALTIPQSWLLAMTAPFTQGSLLAGNSSSQRYTQGNLLAFFHYEANPSVRNSRPASGRGALPGAPLLTGLPPRFFRHWRRSAPPPLHKGALLGEGKGRAPTPMPPRQEKTPGGQAIRAGKGTKGFSRAG